MPRRKNDDATPMIVGLTRLGVESSDIPKLRQVSRRLHTWHEMECNGEVYVADDGTVTRYNVRTGEALPDGDRRPRNWGREACVKLDSIMSRYPELAAYVQGDPRGASLYVYRREELRGRDIDCCYPSVGVAVW